MTASLIGATAFAIAPAGAATAPAGTKAVSAAAFSCHVYNVSGSELNVRSGAGTSYAVIGSIAAKGKLPCGSLGESSVNRQKYKACGITSTEWMTVRIGGRDGWVAVACVNLGV